MKLDKRLVALINSKAGSGGGGGGTVVSVADCDINADGDLIVTLSDGTVINAGNAVGPQGPAGPTGPKGEQGEKGENGTNGTNGVDGTNGIDGISPTIEVYANTTTSYQLKINNADGTSIITPNLLGSGASTTRYYIYDNTFYTNYTDTVYTLFNGALKALSEYITSGSAFCNAENNHALNYNTVDFGWDGSITSFSTVSVAVDPTQFLLFGYVSGAMKDGEVIKFIPAGLVNGTTDAEKATSIKTLLDAGTESIISIPFEYVYATNGVTEAVSLADVTAGEYYIVWTARSDNSRPKITDLTIM